MAETKTLNVRFQQKYDTAENWANSELILLPGEMAIESDTGKFKFGGNGKKFSELNYAGIDQAQLDATNDNFTKLTPADDVTDTASLATIQSPKKGDIAVVERMIGGISTASTMTAYMYDGTQWCALDGNYDASNVYFDSNLTYTSSIGALKLASGKSSDVYEAKGKSLEEVIKRLMAETIPPTIGQPSYSLDSITANVSSPVEVGTKVTQLKWNATFNDGSYSYGHLNADGSVNTATAAGCTATYSMSCDQTGTTTTPTAQDGTWTLTTPYVVKDADTSSAKKTVGTITTKCKIAGSPYKPINNIGEEVDGQIAAKDEITKTGSFSIYGYRAWFCGWKNGDSIIKNANGEKDATAITGAQIRALGTSKNGSWASSMNVDKMQQMFFAAPAGKGSKPAIADSKTTAPQTVKGPFTVSVEGADGYEATDYDVWYVDNDFPASGSATLNITR
jgi:hypothetical protein